MSHGAAWSADVREAFQRTALRWPLSGHHASSTARPGGRCATTRTTPGVHKSAARRSRRSCSMS